MSTSISTQRTVQLPSARVLVGGVYVVCVLGMIALFTGEIVFTDRDPHRNDGPVESIIAISTFGTAALVVGVGLLLWLAHTPERARIGSFLLLALAVVTVAFFWSGAPASWAPARPPALDSPAVVARSPAAPAPPGSSARSSRCSTSCSRSAAC